MSSSCRAGGVISPFSRPPARIRLTVPGRDGEVSVAVSSTVEETVRDLLDGLLRAAEKGARVRRLGSTPEEIVRAIVTSRCGHAWADGGGVAHGYPAETTRLEVDWWRRRDTLFLAVSAYRGRALRSPYPVPPDVFVCAIPSARTMARAVPERYERLWPLLQRRRLALLTRRGLAVPPGLAPVAIRWLRLRDGWAALVWHQGWKPSPRGVSDCDQDAVARCSPWRSRVCACACSAVYLCTRGAWQRLTVRYLSSWTGTADELVLAGLSEDVAWQLVWGQISTDELVAELVLMSLGS